LIGSTDRLSKEFLNLFFEVTFNLKNFISILGSMAHLPTVDSKSNYSLEFERRVCHTAEDKVLVFNTSTVFTKRKSYYSNISFA
jgi:hypothetical protein